MEVYGGGRGGGSQVPRLFSVLRSETSLAHARQNPQRGNACFAVIDHEQPQEPTTVHFYYDVLPVYGSGYVGGLKVPFAP